MFATVGTTLPPWLTPPRPSATVFLLFPPLPFPPLPPPPLHYFMFNISSSIHIYIHISNACTYTGVDYAERDDYELSGVSQISGFQGDQKIPRQYMLYNSYTNVAGEDLDMWTNGAFAIRNQQYKLIHYFDNDAYASWQTPYDLLEDDHEWSSTAFECKTLTGNTPILSTPTINKPCPHPPLIHHVRTINHTILTCTQHQWIASLFRIINPVLTHPTHTSI